jgi:hypothetical protein
MKKILILAAVGAGAIAVALFLPAMNLGALGCYHCFPGGTTPSAWGMGSTCAAANANAVYAAEALISGSCDVCNETVISLEPCNTSCTNPGTCYDPYGMWRVDVKIRYRCNEYICQ